LAGGNRSIVPDYSFLDRAHFLLGFAIRQRLIAETATCPCAARTFNTPQLMLRFENLSKRYNDRIVFAELHHDSAAGCVALNDESGSGKSTLLAILAGALAADSGDVWIGGLSVNAAPAVARSLLTYVPEDCMPSPDPTGREYLQRVAAARNASVSDATLTLADCFGLTPHMDKRFEQMSFGTRKKFFLTSAMLGETSVLIADEPVGGLDAAARAVLVDLFTTLAQTRTVFFSSYDEAFTEACAASRITFADLAQRG
jgi:ABC-type multidrug transport system ATPase subunit